MFTFDRPIRFAEVDSAHIVFFARFLDFCHEALEALFDGVDGGYPHITGVRDLGIPTVRLEVDFRSPLRYGDLARCEVEVLRVGRTSVTVRHVIRRAADGHVAAIVRQVFVLTRLSTLLPVPLPDDLHALFTSHLASEERLDALPAGETRPEGESSTSNRSR